ncbi:MAG: hypothetical protein PHR25_06555 [Clostridia bacterium]|nr:hypothetical protein [Clostridia bacterium]
MNEKDLSFLFNEVPLYTSETFNVFDLDNNQYSLNKEEYARFLVYIGILQEKIISLCHKCKKEFPFEVDREFFLVENNGKRNEHYMPITNPNSYDIDGRIRLYNGTIEGAQPPYGKDKLLQNHIFYIHYIFQCANSDNHNYMMMVSVELKDGKFKVRKIGQNPSMLTVKGFDFDKYKSFLEKINAYEDYKKADMCNSEHFYVGAYAYLRRIFEKMIKNYVGKTKLKDDHIDTKIDAVKDQFDPRTSGLLKNLYGILSISIHELDEETSKEYYSYLKAVIDMQLEFVKSESDKDNQSKDLNAVLNKIVNLVKK